ncbi:MAG: HAD family hydrolase [Halopenitus sp.]
MRAILFDLDGTLLHYTRDYRDVLADAIRAVDGEVREEWLDAYDDRFFDILEACGPDPYRRAYAPFGSDPDAFRTELLEREVEACEPPPGAHADLARLGERFHLGVLSNGVREWQLEKLRSFDLLDHFDAVVTSDEAGAHKPDSAVFSLAEDRLPAEGYALVGDADADVEGGRAVGWAVHRYGGDGYSDLPAAFGWD